jgi:hypothetical protein
LNIPVLGITAILGSTIPPYFDDSALCSSSAAGPSERNGHIVFRSFLILLLRVLASLVTRLPVAIASHRTSSLSFEKAGRVAIAQRAIDYHFLRPVAFVSYNLLATFAC